MGKRNTRKNKKKIVKYECNNISENRMIEIQAEAFYRALKRIENERLDNKEQVSEPKKDKWYVRLFMLNAIFFPWKIHKRFKTNKEIYDSPLIVVISLVLQIIGTLIWLLGFFMIGFAVYQFIKDKIIINLIIIFLVGIGLFGLGSLFVLAASEFSKETDSNKIYAYSASVLALISCVISMIALLKS